MNGVVKVIRHQVDHLPDNTQYTNRFEIHSETSSRVYVIAQSKSGRWWSCSCPGWIRHRNCKHLKALGLPGQQQPMEVSFSEDK